LEILFRRLLACAFVIAAAFFVFLSTSRAKTIASNEVATAFMPSAYLDHRVRGKFWSLMWFAIEETFFKRGRGFVEEEKKTYICLTNMPRSPQVISLTNI
jgi:hypothetical protein